MLLMLLLLLQLLLNRDLFCVHSYPVLVASRASSSNAQKAQPSGQPEQHIQYQSEDSFSSTTKHALTGITNAQSTDQISPDLDSRTQTQNNQPFQLTIHLTSTNSTQSIDYESSDEPTPPTDLDWDTIDRNEASRNSIIRYMFEQLYLQNILPDPSLAEPEPPPPPTAPVAPTSLLGSNGTGSFNATAGRPYYGDAFYWFQSVYWPIHCVICLVICTLGIFANVTNIIVLTR